MTTQGQEALATFDGIYDVAESARYLRATFRGDKAYVVSSAKLIRWIRRGLASPELVQVPGTELLIAFEDLVSMRVIAVLRAAGVSWLDIDQTEKWLRDNTAASRPFATETLWTGQGQVFAELTNRLVSAIKHGQLALDMLREFVMPLHGLTFNEESQVAESWEPTDGIVLRPIIQFGAPCLKGTRIPTRTISGMVEAGDSRDWVARAFGISTEQVRVACDWESRIQSN